MKYLLKKRKNDSHKGSYGRLGVIGGSRGMAGAPYLTALSAFRTGVGYSYILVPRTIEMIMSIKLTEGIIRPIEDGDKGHFIRESLLEILTYIENMDVLAVGPGMGVDIDRIYLITEILKKANIPIVLDADALNCISSNPSILEVHKNDIVITPHPGELSRLLNISTNDLQANRVYYSEYVANKYNIVVVLKGYETVVAFPGFETYINKTGNPGMATAGTGDVLTGVIASLIAQGLKPFDAAKLGVYLHGLAGDITKEEMGEYGMMAGDIIENIPIAINTYGLGM